MRGLGFADISVYVDAETESINKTLKTEAVSTQMIILIETESI